MNQTVEDLVLTYMDDPSTRETVEGALQGYITCALWSMVDYEKQDYVDAKEERVADVTRGQALKDVVEFLAICWGDVWDEVEVDLSRIEAGQIGHDLWLTRNRHGAGFWDRGLGEVGEALTEISHNMGEQDWYVGDDGLIYWM